MTNRARPMLHAEPGIASPRFVRAADLQQHKVDRVSPLIKVTRSGAPRGLHVEAATIRRLSRSQGIEGPFSTTATHAISSIPKTRLTHEVGL